METVCPDIAADFDIRNNGVTAAEVTSVATTEYSWLSDEPGALWLSALSIQGKSSTLRLGAHDNAANSNACSVFLGDATALHSLLVYVHDCAFVNAVFGES